MTPKRIMPDAVVLEARAAVMAAVDREAPIAELMGLYASYVLARRGGNRSHAATTLGLERRTILRWLKRGRTADLRQPPLPGVGTAVSDAAPV